MSRSPDQHGSKSHCTLVMVASAWVARWGRIGSGSAMPPKGSALATIGLTSGPVVELQLALFDLDPDLLADLLPGGQVPLADEGDRGPLAPGARVRPTRWT